MTDAEAAVFDGKASDGATPWGNICMSYHSLYQTPVLERILNTDIVFSYSRPLYIRGKIESFPEH